MDSRPSLTTIDRARNLFDSAQSAFSVWRHTEIPARVGALKVALDSLQAGAEGLAHLISEEVGKPITQSRLEIARVLEEWRYMVDYGEGFLAPENVGAAEVHFAPLGVVVVISPWNFPALLPLRGIVPALLAGNSVLFKPSELSPRTGSALVELFDSTVPLFVATGGKDLGAALVAAPVSAIAFTGSTAVGKWIARESSQKLKRIILELGGLDAAIVLKDADVVNAAREIVRYNARNSGQVCNAVKRVLVHSDVYEHFLSRALEEAQKLSYGDPLDDHTEVGPLVSEGQRARVQSFLDDAVSKGAKVARVKARSDGLFFPQAILFDVPQDAKLLKEEPFGPLLPVLRFFTEDEAIEIANNTDFGLTASVWTNDQAAFRRIASKLDVGMVRCNSHAAMQPGVPWGGCKESGVGRMKTKEGLREFTNVKVIA